jgi:ribulose-5-phosphate 4-epimerase/fuculose-1-phosphate aldolase
VVAHTHALHASILSGSGEALLPYTLDADYFVELPRHEDEVALITTAQEGAALARSLGPHFAVLMANHGVTFCGTSIEHATCVGVFLEKACRAHLLGRAAGLRPSPLEPQVRAKRHAQIMTAAHIQHSWDYLCRAWT